MTNDAVHDDTDDEKAETTGCTCGTADGASCNCGDKCNCGSASTSTADIQIDREPVSSDPGR